MASSCNPVESLSMASSCNPVESRVSLSPSKAPLPVSPAGSGSNNSQEVLNGDELSVENLQSLDKKDLVATIIHLRDRIASDSTKNSSPPDLPKPTFQERLVTVMGEIDRSADNIANAEDMLYETVTALNARANTTSSNLERRLDKQAELLLSLMERVKFISTQVSTIVEHRFSKYDELLTTVLQLSNQLMSSRINNQSATTPSDTPSCSETGHQVLLDLTENTDRRSATANSTTIPIDLLGQTFPAPEANNRKEEADRRNALSEPTSSRGHPFSNQQGQDNPISLPPKEGRKSVAKPNSSSNKFSTSATKTHPAAPRPGQENSKKVRKNVKNVVSSSKNTDATQRKLEQQHQGNKRRSPAKNQETQRSNSESEPPPRRQTRSPPNVPPTKLVYRVSEATLIVNGLQLTSDDPKTVVEHFIPELKGLADKMVYLWTSSKKQSVYIGCSELGFFANNCARLGLPLPRLDSGGPRLDHFRSPGNAAKDILRVFGENEKRNGADYYQIRGVRIRIGKGDEIISRYFYDPYCGETKRLADDLIQSFDYYFPRIEPFKGHPHTASGQNKRK